MTRVGTCDIQVRGHFASIVTFWSGEHGKKEQGDYAFWTAVLAEPVTFEIPADVGKPRRTTTMRRITGRAQVGYPAGDRFDRMKREMRTANSLSVRRAYRQMWVRAVAKGKNIRFIRPATWPEIARWLKVHDKDRPHADPWMHIDGKLVLIEADGRLSRKRPRKPPRK
jgi:hypothetical protein